MVDENEELRIFESDNERLRELYIKMNSLSSEVARLSLHLPRLRAMFLGKCAEFWMKVEEIFPEVSEMTFRPFLNEGRIIFREMSEEECEEYMKSFQALDDDVDEDEETDDEEYLDDDD